MTSDPSLLCHLRGGNLSKLAQPDTLLAEDPPMVFPQDADRLACIRLEEYQNLPASFSRLGRLASHQEIQRMDLSTPDFDVGVDFLHDVLT